MKARLLPKVLTQKNPNLFYGFGCVLV